MTDRMDRAEKASAAADRYLVDVIRERFGMAPLYGADGGRATDAERFVDPDVIGEHTRAFDFANSHGKR